MDQPATAITRLAPAGGLGTLGLREIVAHRELLYFLVWRDVKVRYRQTALGGLWALLQPLLTVAIFTIIFGRLAGFSSGDVPYEVFCLAGVVPWLFFSNGVASSSGSLVANTSLIQKVYFPRLLLPVAAILAGVLDLTIALAASLLVAAFLAVRLAPTLLFAPLFLGVALLTCLGAGLWLSALNVRYRDVRHLLPFLLQTWMYLTPIVYPTTLIPERWHSFYGLNPMVTVIEGVRWSLLSTSCLTLPMALASLASAACLLLSGLVYFRMTERTFADVV